MNKEKQPKLKFFKLLSLGIAVLVLFVMSTVFVVDWIRLNAREQDTPPVIEFTWTPIGPVDLKEMRGYLKITDDYGLDFSTYRMTILELDRSFDMPIDGLIGREYETPLSLSLLADKEEMVGRRKITLKFDIADDRGQAVSLERTIHLKPGDQVEQTLKAGDSAVGDPLEILQLEYE